MRWSYIKRCVVLAVVALGCAGSVAWALRHELSQTKEELGLTYKVETSAHDSGRITAVLTITSAGNLKPIDSIQLHVPAEDKSGYADVSVTLAAEEQEGIIVCRAHLKRELAERAQFELVTHSPPDGKSKPSPRTIYYFAIPVKEHLKK